MVYTSEMSSVCFSPWPGVIHLPSHFQAAYANRIIITGFPDPFAVATINGEQTKTTQVSKRTLNPYWNEHFDL